MVWNTKGAERGKAYAVYRELEAKFNVLQKDYSALQGELERKNVIIRTLSAELAAYAQTLAPESSEVAELSKRLIEAALEAPRLPTRTTQGAFQRPLAKAQPTEQRTVTRSGIPPETNGRPMAARIAELEAELQDIRKAQGQK